MAWGLWDMVFWRSRAAKKAETTSEVDNSVSEPKQAVTSTDKPADAQKPEPSKAEAEPQPESAAADESKSSNVVALVPNRLSDRLADVAETGKSNVHVLEVAEAATIKPASATAMPGQAAAISRLRAALNSKRAHDHILLLGPPESGRLDLAKALAAEVTRPAAQEWVYAVDPALPSRAVAHSFPAGDGSAFTREVGAAVARAASAFARYLGGDEHRLNVDLLNEDVRFRGETAIEHIRRKAEAQNIAVVKSLEGYVLAPMHEGRVVRSDVFRALPDALKKNVEAKIAVLEDELKDVVSGMPIAELKAAEDFDIILRDGARRAIMPALDAVRSRYAGDQSAEALLERVEASFLAAAVRLGSAGLVDLAALEQAALLLSVDVDGSVDANVPVLSELDCSPAALAGEVSLDAHGRAVVAPGVLARAGSGFVIVDAWRLAADPSSWLALSAILSSRRVTPVHAQRGGNSAADGLPLTATVIVIADEATWQKLKAIEPGIARHFPHVVKLTATAAALEVTEAEFAGGAAQLADANDLHPIASSASLPIYADALRRGGGRVSLDRGAVLRLLRDADFESRSRGGDSITTADISEAIVRRGDSEAL